jgi:hypothetical protein
VARAGATTTRRCAQFVLRRLVADRATVAAVARELGRSWDTINTIAMEATTELLDAAGPARLHVAPSPRCAFRSLRSQLGQREKALTGHARGALVHPQHSGSQHRGGGGSIQNPSIMIKPAKP